MLTTSAATTAPTAPTAPTTRHFLIEPVNETADTGKHSVEFSPAHSISPADCTS